MAWSSICIPSRFAFLQNEITVSAGVYDQAVNDALGNSIRAGDTDNSSDLGNGEQSYGYAIKGVEFTYLRVAGICQFTESAADGAASNHVEVLYGIDKTNGADLLAAIGLADGAGRYENADNSDKLDSNNYYYQSDVLIDALRTSLEANATTVKNALENYVKANGGTALPLTDAYGHTAADGLPLGLYLVVETRVPEMVIDTTAPFFVSLPMTSVDGSKNMPQKHLEHHLLTASATVDGNAVTMLTDNGSANAEAPLRVVNTRGFDLPKTGDNGTKMLTICGTFLILCAGGCVVLLIVSKRKKDTRQ